jgi:serine/threonine protein kinase
MFCNVDKPSRDCIMETRTIIFDTPKETVALTRRLITRLMRIAIWLAVMALLVLAFIIGYGVLRFSLMLILPLETTIIVAASVPALLVGLVFQPLQQRVMQLVEAQIVHQPPDLEMDFNFDDTRNDFPIPDAMAGKQIGSYELQEVIGRGGMAEVYQAVGNDSIVAIKVMHQHYLYDEENLRRFEREGEFGLGMNHEHIAAVYEFGKIEQVPYIVMEFVDGEDLRSIIRRTDDYTIDDVVLWMDDICGALDMAHQQGYVHRDIKPSNIMVRPTGDAVLMDFGIAKFKHATTHITGASVGTIDYMAPEQIQNSQNIDHRADIYALGIVIYELLTGMLPYEGSIPQVMYAHINHSAPDPREINVAVPKYMAEAVMKALAKKPEDRFQSAGEFAQALHG